MITIIDYGVGNVKAFINVYRQLNIPINSAKNKDELINASKIILPGVGSFDHVIQKLNNSGMRKALDELVLDKRVPVLGICVGMQMLAKSSEEGTSLGLGWLDAEVIRFDPKLFLNKEYIPHMGWNDVSVSKSTGLFRNLEQNARFYFLHSYYFSCNNIEDSIAVTNYGIEFTSAVFRNNIFGVQFHPEKSHQWGIQLLNNFAAI